MRRIHTPLCPLRERSISFVRVFIMCLRARLHPRARASTCCPRLEPAARTRGGSGALQNAPDRRAPGPPRRAASRRAAAGGGGERSHCAPGAAPPCSPTRTQTRPCWAAIGTRSRGPQLGRALLQVQRQAQSQFWGCGYKLETAELRQDRFNDVLNRPDLQGHQRPRIVSPSGYQP